MFIMYGRNSEHRFYSFTPKCAAQATQRVGKARRGFQWVPRLNDKVTFVGLLQQIPQPNHGVQPLAQIRRPFGAFALECLRMLTTEKLLGVFERIFYRPAIGVTYDPANLAYAGDDPYKALLAFQDRVVLTHWKDFSCIDGKKAYQAFGEG